MRQFLILVLPVLLHTIILTCLDYWNNLTAPPMLALPFILSMKHSSWIDHFYVEFNLSHSSQNTVLLSLSMKVKFLIMACDGPNYSLNSYFTTLDLGQSTSYKMALLLSLPLTQQKHCALEESALIVSFDWSFLHSLTLVFTSLTFLKSSLSQMPYFW